MNSTADVAPTSPHSVSTPWSAPTRQPPSPTSLHYRCADTPPEKRMVAGSVLGPHYPIYEANGRASSAALRSDTSYGS